MSDKLAASPWYKEGLRFGCTQCGKCCTGSPGYVWIEEIDVEKMAEFLKISVKDFFSKYTRQVGDRLALLENPRNYDCVFLKNKMCQVYGARPKQCKTFPWWPEHLKSKQEWEETAKRCEGINHPDAPIVSLSDIENQLTIQQN